MIWHCFKMFLHWNDAPRVSPAVTRLPVYRGLQVRIPRQLVGLPSSSQSFGSFFKKLKILWHQAYLFVNSYFLTLIMPRHMQEGLLLYRLLGRRKDTNRWCNFGSKFGKNLKIFNFKRNLFRINRNAFEKIWHCLKGRCWSNHALRVSPAVTRLTIYRRLQVETYKIPKIYVSA